MGIWLEPAHTIIIVLFGSTTPLLGDLIGRIEPDLVRPRTIAFFIHYTTILQSSEWIRWKETKQKNRARIDGFRPFRHYPLSIWVQTAVRCGYTCTDCSCLCDKSDDNRMPADRPDYQRCAEKSKRKIIWPWQHWIVASSTSNILHFIFTYARVIHIFLFSVVWPWLPLEKRDNSSSGSIRPPVTARSNVSIHTINTTYTYNVVTQSAHTFRRYSPTRNTPGCSGDHSARRLVER